MVSGQPADLSFPRQPPQPPIPPSDHPFPTSSFLHALPCFQSAEPSAKENSSMPANQPSREEAGLECRRGVTKLFVSGPAEKCEQLPFLGKVRTPVGKDPGLGLSFPRITTTAFMGLLIQ